MRVTRYEIKMKIELVSVESEGALDKRVKEG